jgi:hypothetical protein
MDGTADTSSLLDHSLRLFDKEENQFKGAFVDGISLNRLEKLFDHTTYHNGQYSYTEIVDTILHKVSRSEAFIDSFKRKCKELNLRVRVYTGTEEKEIVSDSLSSDLFVIGKNILRKKDTLQKGRDIVEAILRQSKCPVLLLANQSKAFKQIVLLFDGSEKAFESIKLFVYLMGAQLAENKVTLFTIINDASVTHETQVCDYLKSNKQFFSIMRVYPENYYVELKSLLHELDEFLLVAGTHREEIIENIVFSNEHSFYLDGNRSVFMI